MPLHNVVFMCVASIVIIGRSNQLHAEWEPSSNLDKWYTALDICLLSNSTSNPIESIMKQCEEMVIAMNPRTELKPTRCRSGNSWPSKGAFCSSVDIPYSHRDNLRMSMKGYDDPTQKPLRKLFTSLSKEKGALLLVGDSVMQQYYNAMACELEREGVWEDPSQFKNTDALKYVKIDSTKDAHSVPIRFTPIYHFVNGKYDRVVSFLDIYHYFYACLHHCYQ